MNLKKVLAATLLTSSLLSAAYIAPIGGLTPSAYAAEETKNLPNIKILATGGTIASTAASNTAVTGYQVTQGVEAIVNAVPSLKNIANITGEQIVNVGSPNMTPEIWLNLARKVNEYLASDDVDGIVITHGTNTIEETAYFLNLTVKSDKPVVLVGAMRPASAMSADGPFNLYNAVSVAGNPKAKGKGVMVVLNDRISAARFVSKTNTTTLDTFKSVEQGYMGQITGNRVQFHYEPIPKHTTKSVFDVSKIDSLPQVDIVYEYPGIGGYFYDAALAAGAKGIVVAGSGDGGMSTKSTEKAKEAGKKAVIVRSSYVGDGTVNNRATDAENNFVAADSLNPHKSRILLMLALTQTNDPKKIQEFFNEY